MSGEVKKGSKLKEVQVHLLLIYVTSRNVGTDLQLSFISSKWNGFSRGSHNLRLIIKKIKISAIKRWLYVVEKFYFFIMSELLAWGLSRNIFFYLVQKSWTEVSFNVQFNLLFSIIVQRFFRITLIPKNQTFHYFYARYPTTVPVSFIS